RMRRRHEPFRDPIRRMCWKLAARDNRGPTDGELLAAFLVREEEAAFEALVHRHGPMVLAVCRRVLGNLHEAEDAFQATFLVLLRKARSIGRPEQLSNWLHGVAYRTALKARGRNMRWCPPPAPRREASQEEPDAELLRQELSQMLDDELTRLPTKYRLPILLHYLQGRTKQQTARQLDWPEGTVSSRLVRGLDLLRRRLARRGVTCSGAVLAAALGSVTEATAAPSLPLTAALGAAAGSAGLA